MQIVIKNCNDDDERYTDESHIKELTKPISD